MTHSVENAMVTMTQPTRWSHWETLFWLASLALLPLFPTKALLFSQIAIMGLFALSLDLILGYAGIVSLGHAAFFGIGAYVAGLMAKHGFGDPTLGLVAAAAGAALIGFVTSFLLLRGSDLTRLMVTLGIALMLFEAANRFASITGGADGLQGMMVKPVLGLFTFDLFGRTAYLYSLTILFLLLILARRIVYSPFGLSLRAVKANSLRASAIGISSASRLVAIYTLSAAYAGVAGALSAQTTQLVSLDVLDFHRSADVMLVLVIGGVGWLYGGIIGAVIFSLMQDWLAGITPQYWEFWIGLVLVVLVLVGHGRLQSYVRLIVQSITQKGRVAHPDQRGTS
jgi:branched-chain amino acid transport system permease protein